jgi:glycerophosphoryl diester phosphodiesterase
MLQSLRRPIVFAHRGASAHAPENTLAAFRLAREEGADAIELDAKLSQDGQVVVFHDPRLERTTNGSGFVWEHSAEQLRALDAGNHFSTAFRGERIPLLEEVFDAVGTPLYINVELTNYRTPHDRLVQTACELVGKKSLQGRVMFSSFLPSNLEEARRLLPNVPRGLLAKPGWRGAWARSFLFAFGDYAAIHINVADANRQEIQRVHRLGRRVHAWPVNNAEAMRQLAEWGVDGIITADPGLALRQLGRQG